MGIRRQKVGQHHEARPINAAAEGRSTLRRPFHQDLWGSIVEVRRRPIYDVGIPVRSERPKVDLKFGGGQQIVGIQELDELTACPPEAKVPCRAHSPMGLGEVDDSWIFGR
jgi:hypothetical protein